MIAFQAEREAVPPGHVGVRGICAVAGLEWWEDKVGQVRP